MFDNAPCNPERFYNWLIGNAVKQEQGTEVVIASGTAESWDFSDAWINVRTCGVG